MAVAYLTEGATDFAAANWSDATGFGAATPTLVIEKGSQTVVSSLDQSGLASGVNYLEVRRTFFGNIGSASAGPLKVDADNGSSPHIYYGAGGGVFYLQAGGNNTLITTLEVNGAGTAYLQGGTFTTADLLAGTVYANQSTVMTSLYQSGGTATVEYNATALTNLYVASGLCVVKRAVTNAIIGGGTVIVDIDSGSFGATTFTMTGGVLVLRSGNIPNWTWIAGELRASELRRDATIAGTAATVYPLARGVLQRAPGATLTWTTANITYRGTNAGFIGGVS